jgi:hypothetical protein
MGGLTPGWIWEIVQFGLCVSLLGLTAVVCRRAVRRTVPAASQPVPPVPEAPDPYEVAYLRGGAKEVGRVVAFCLLERGYLQVTTKPSPGSQESPGVAASPGARVMWSVTTEPSHGSQESPVQQIERAPDAPDPRALCELERRVLRWVFVPRAGWESFFPPVIEPCCVAFQERLESQGLLTSGRTRATALRVWLAGHLMLLVGVGLLWTLLWRGDMSVVGPLLVAVEVLLFASAVYSWPRRLTSRGQAYVNQLRQAFQPRRSSSRMPGTAGREALPLLIALFGATAALSGTPWERYLAVLEEPSYDQSCA